RPNQTAACSIYPLVPLIGTLFTNALICEAAPFSKAKDELRATQPEVEGGGCLMAPWTYADIWEAIAPVQPDLPALIQGSRTLSWGEFDQQACAIAGYLRASGIKAGAKLGIFMPNAPEYLVAFNAALKISVAPFNINYRYGPSEVAYLIDNADAEAVVFDVSFAG